MRTEIFKWLKFDSCVIFRSVWFIISAQVYNWFSHQCRVRTNVHTSASAAMGISQDQIYSDKWRVGESTLMLFEKLFPNARVESLWWKCLNARESNLVLRILFRNVLYLQRRRSVLFLLQSNYNTYNYSQPCQVLFNRNLCSAIYKKYLHHFRKEITTTLNHVSNHFIFKIMCKVMRLWCWSRVSQKLARFWGKPVVLRILLTIFLQHLVVVVYSHSGSLHYFQHFTHFSNSRLLTGYQHHKVSDQKIFKWNLFKSCICLCGFVNFGSWSHIIFLHSFHVFQ